MEEIFLKKCRDCHCFEEEWHKDEDGKSHVDLSCGRTGSRIPNYDYTPKHCLGFRWNYEAWKEKGENQ